MRDGIPAPSEDPAAKTPPHPPLVGVILNAPRATILLASIVWALCYPPFPFGLLGFVVLAPAFLATFALTPRQAFRAWFLAGLAYNTVMCWWIYNVMKVGPALLIAFGLVLLILFLSLFNGLAGWAFRRALDARRRTLLLLLFPFAWAGLEAARAVGEMSFPWTNLGYTLGNWPVLFQSVGWWGVYGLSAAMVAANLLLARALYAESGRRAAWYAAFVAVPVLLALHGGIVLLRADDRDAPRLDIALVQPSIPQTKKWGEEYFQAVMGKTFRTVEGAAEDLAPVRGADLILFPETAVPDFLRTRPQIADSLRAIARMTGATVLTGALHYVPERLPWSDYRFFNSAFLFRPGVEGWPDEYAKLRLVPFSEKLPFNGIFPVINYVNLGDGGFSPGDGHRLWGDRVPWSPSICYEVIYPSFARQARNTGALLLVNVTNDGWFGRTNGPYQHANIARFRAAENGFPVARAANNGVSVFYDAWGRDLGRTALMDSTVLRRTVHTPDRRTAYAAAGSWIDAALLITLAGWGALLAAARGRRGSSL